MTTTPLPAVQSNRFRYALPAQRLPEGAYELSDDGTVWRIPGPPLPYNSSGWASMWRLVHPNDVRQTGMLQRNTSCLTTASTAAPRVLQTAKKCTAQPSTEPNPWRAVQDDPPWIAHRLPDRDPRQPVSTLPQDPRPCRHHDRRGQNRDGTSRPSPLDPATEQAQPRQLTWDNQGWFAHPSCISAATTSSSTSRSPRRNVALFNFASLPLTCAPRRQDKSLSTPASLGPNDISFAPLWHLPTRGRSGPPGGGGMVTQNRAAVDTRTASNNPQVAANNDDFSLVEDDNPPTGSTRVWARTSPSTWPRQVTSPSRLGPTNATGPVESAQFPPPRAVAREPNPRLRELTIDPRLRELTIDLRLMELTTDPRLMELTIDRTSGVNAVPDTSVSGKSA